MSLALASTACGAAGAEAPASPRVVEMAASDGGSPRSEPTNARDAASPSAAPSSAVTPCKTGTPAHGEATAAVDSLRRGIASLGAEDDPKALGDALRALLATPCFRLLHESDPLVFDSGLSLRSWWEAGGERWVRHALALDTHGPIADGGTTSPAFVWVSPTPRRTLTRESAPSSPLAPLLCSARDEDCGRETRGWTARTHDAFEHHARERQPVGLEHNAHRRCRDEALADRNGEWFEAFRSCMELNAGRTRALPLGRFRAPREGWLVLRGRRGHYPLCDETRAYDLATGIAYIAGSCSGLALRADGSVDRTTTSPAKAGHITVSEAGRLPIENLREAALMTLLAPETQDDVIEHGFGWVLPGEIVVEARTSRSGRLFPSGRHSTAQSTITWAWLRAGRTVASGELTWPFDSDHAGSDHAVKLIAIAEAAFTPLGPKECAEAAPPLPELESLRGRACRAKK